MATVVHPPPPSPSPSPEAIKPEKIDHMNLPCPVPYEEINREALMSLKAEHFEGMRADITKALNQRFSLSHSIVVGPPIEIPSLYDKPTKIPSAHYGFGANFMDPKLTLLGRITIDGLVNSAVKCDLSENLSTKIYGQLTSEPNMSRGVVNFDYKGTDYRTQFQFGNGGLLGALELVIFSVTPRPSIGGNVLWAGEHRESGIGYAAQYNADKMVASGQIASNGEVALSYVQKISKKISLASDLIYNYMSRDVTASFGYDYILRQVISKVS